MRHLLPISIAVFVVAALAIFVFGDSGVSSYAELARYKTRLAANVDKLREHNAELTTQLDRLRTDPDTNAVLAHGIGLYRADDEVVKVEGTPARTNAYVVGDLLRMRHDGAPRNPVLKAVAMGIALLLVAYAALSSRKRAHGSQGR